jgi:serine/threonine-protein kinase RsbW
MTDFGDSHHEVAITVPARAEYVSVIRSLAATLAARCDLTVDEIDDLRIGVDEACGLLFPLASAASDELAPLSTIFTLSEGSISMYASIYADGQAQPDESGFAWTVLNAVADEIHVLHEDNTIAIRLFKHRQPLAS